MFKKKKLSDIRNEAETSTSEVDDDEDNFDRYDKKKNNQSSCMKLIDAKRQKNIDD